MGIFNEFNKKEKPVFTGSRFGFGSGGGGAGATGFSASGGTKILGSDGSTYHIFQYPNSENLVVTGTETKPAMIFLIGGGGGGGIQHAGGGGAGALYLNPDYSISPGTYPVTIGAGGAGGPGGGVGSAGNGSPGSNSVFNDVTMLGGGGGGRMTVSGTAGGSGGGGGMDTTTPFPGTSATPGGAVTAPPTTPSSSPLLHANAGGTGTGYYQYSGGGVGGGGGGAGGTGTSTPPGPGPIGDPGKGGDDYLWTGIPSPVMPEIAAGLGTPTKLLGVPLDQPVNYRRAYAGGGGAGSHSPWNIYNAPWTNEYGTHPDGQNQGGGSGNRTGGKGGLGNNNRGQPGVEGRGGGGGGSGGSPNAGGHGGAGICIVKYTTA